MTLRPLDKLTALYIDGVPVLMDGIGDALRERWRGVIPAAIEHLESLGDRVVWCAPFDGPYPLVDDDLELSLKLFSEHVSPYTSEMVQERLDTVDA